jgi:hypothetical protein
VSSFWGALRFSFSVPTDALGKHPTKTNFHQTKLRTFSVFSWKSISIVSEKVEEAKRMRNMLELVRKPVVLAIVFVVLTWFAASGTMFYSFGSGEHDTFMMVAGILHGEKTGQVINPLNYGSDLQFMFYYLFNMVLRVVPLTYDQILLSMNIIGTLLSLLIPILLLVLLRRSFDLGSPEIVPIILVTSPAYLYTLPYGHPFHIAFSFCLFSLICFFGSYRGAGCIKSTLLFLLAVIMMAVALTIRADQVILFWFVIGGLLIYARERKRTKWFGLFCLLSLSAAVFFLSHSLLVPPQEMAGPAERSISTVMNLVRLVIGTYKFDALLWSMAHHITEIALPLIVLCVFAAIKFLRKKESFMLFGFAVSLMPSALTYLVNPSPPRHFIITIIALAIFLSVSIGPKKLLWAPVFGVALLAFNLLLPPALATISGKAADVRPACTYNIIQRHLRNKEQIKASLPFFSDLVLHVPSNTIIFGQWVHIAQITMLLSDRKDLEFKKVKMSGVTGALRLTYGGKEMYLVEAYNAKIVGEIVEELHGAGKKFRFISLLSDDLHGDDVIVIRKPKQLLWWNA